MKIVSRKLLYQLLGDAQLNLFQLEGNENYILTIQDRTSGTLAIVGVKENGDFEFQPEDLPNSGSCLSISDVSLSELTVLHSQLGKLIEKEKSKKEKKEKKDK